MHNEIHHKSTGIAKINCLTTPSVIAKVEHLKASGIAGTDVTWYSHFEDRAEVSQKAESIYLSYIPVISSYGKKIKICGYIIYNSQKIKTWVDHLDLVKAIRKIIELWRGLISDNW